MELRDEELMLDTESRVERETVVDAGPGEVWEALTDDERLSEWIAPEVELDPVEGGEVIVRTGDEERRGTVEEVDDGERLAFTWERPGEGPSHVEFTIEAVPAGTRVVVVETALAPSPAFGPTASAAWGAALSRLRRSLLVVFA